MFRSVLVVDDFACWRRFVSCTLKRNTSLQVIGEVSDGLEAVQKAQELKPDLIVLDIGLPHLNGIEAARQIRRVSPNSKILFLTENRFPEIAARCLLVGANGYVVKSDAATELMIALEAVLEGRQFVSARFTGHNVGLAADIAPVAVPRIDAD